MKRPLVLLSIGALLLTGCSAGYNYNPQEIDCKIPPYYSVCAWSVGAELGPESTIEAPRAVARGIQ